MKEMDKRERSLEASSFQSYDLNIYDWPLRGEVTGFFRRWKGFQPQAALPGFNSCRKLFIPLSATGLESGCSGYNHFVSKVSPWCASPISALVKLGWNFFVPVPKYLSPSAPKPMASESPIWTCTLENPESTYNERNVVMLWTRAEAKNAQEEYGSYFKKQKNVSCNLKRHSLSDKVAVSPKLLWS